MTEPDSEPASSVSWSTNYSMIWAEILTVAIASKASSNTQPNQSWIEYENYWRNLPRPSSFCFDRINIRMVTMETHTMLGKVAKKRQTGCRPLFPIVWRYRWEKLESEVDACHWRRRFYLFTVTWKFASRLHFATIPTVWYILQHQNPTDLPPRYAFNAAMTCFEKGFE